jgi:hypothetical protein
MRCAVIPSQLNRSLQELFLSWNKIDATGAKALADALQVIAVGALWPMSAEPRT